MTAPTGNSPGAAPPRPRQRWPARVLATLRRWARSGWAIPAVATWSLLQSSVVPGPGAALIVPLGLAEPKRAYVLMWWAILGSLLGAMIAYALGAFAFDRIEPALAWIGADRADMTKARDLFARRGWLMIVLGSLFPLLSTKGVAIAAGLLGYPFAKFVLAILLVRCAQFFLIATGLRYGGPRMKEVFARRLGLPPDEPE